MLKLLVKRTILGAAMLLAVSVAIFLVTEVLPGDLAGNILGPQAAPEEIAALRAELRLDRPIVERYVEWLSSAARGDLGRSMANKRPVTALIGPRLVNTVFLVFYVAVIAIPLSAVLGILAAAFHRRGFDKIVKFGALAAISMPEFLIGSCLVLVLSAHLKLFPAISTIRPEQHFFQHLYATSLPMLTLALVVAAHMTRTIRTAIVDVLHLPYAEMAELKGVSKGRIVLHHALPNAMASIISVIAGNLPYLVAGVVVVEVVFTFNGIGRLMVEAVWRRDIPVVQGCGLIFAIIFIGLNAVADMLSFLSNPRLRRPQ